MKKLKLFFALFAMLALGVGNAWGAEKITDYSKIVTGKTYYIGATTGGTDYYLSVSGASTSTSTSIAGTAKTDKANATAFVFTGSGTSWTIKFADYANYLGLKSSKDNGKVQVVSSAVTFTASNQSEKLRLSISGYSIQKNNSGTQFGSYGNTQTDIWLEEVPGSSEPTTQYTIKWHTAKGVTTDVTLNEGATITKPATDPTMSGYVFMGWTEDCEVASDGAGFTAIENFGTATEDKAYYAVFAKATTTGGGAATETTVSVVIKDYASAKSWVNSTKYTTIEVDANITATVTGGTNTGKYYTSGNEWRLYQTESPKLTISAKNDLNIKTVKVTYNQTNNGVLELNSSNVTSGTVKDVNTSSITFSVGNTSSATNGQVKVTAMEVVYTSGGGTTTYSDYITTCASGIEYIELGDDFKWSAAEAEVTIDATDNVFPSLTNTHNVPVTYSSSDETIASIAADGTVTLKKEGSVTITAKYEGGTSVGTDKEYKATSVTYSLKVNKAVAQPTGTMYVKVTDAVTDGEYLIVYETGKVAFDGSLATLDVAGNMIEAQISSNTIAGNTEIDAATFTIASMAGGHSIQSKSGKYIGRTSNSNGMNTGNSAIANVITFSDGTVKVAGSGSGASASLQYFAQSGSERFRYYTTSQKAIALYKKASEQTVTIATCENGSVSASVANGAKVLSGTTITLDNEPATNYKLAAYDVYKTGDNTTKVTVTDGKFIMPEFDVTISATFELAKTLTEIKITTPATQTTFWQGETFNSTGLKVTAHFDGAEYDDVTSKITVTGSTATAGTQTVTVSYNEGATTKTATYNITVKAIPNSKETAYTVADAFDIIDKLGDTDKMYITGFVSQADLVQSTIDQYKNADYWISADGTTNGQQLEAYRGKYLDNADFTSVNQIMVGDEVIIYGKLTKYNSIYEFAAGNYLVSLKRDKQQPELSYTTTEYNVNLGDAFTAPTLNNPHTLAVTYSSNNEDVATVAANGAVTIKAAGTVTITASFAGNASYAPGEASYTIKVMGIASLPFAFDGKCADIANTAGMSQEGIDLNDYTSSPYLKINTTGDYLTIHFDSEPDKLTYDIKGNSFSGGTFTVQESADGETYTTIATYTELGEKVSEEKELESTSRYVKFIYTEKVNGNVALGNISITKPDTRKDAGLAWSEETVTLTVGDAFTAPTLSNPYTVSGINYESSNDEVATVTTEGVIALGSATGTATITATFAGDATYKPATATCVVILNEYVEIVSGVWQLVTDAATLKAGDKVIVASADAVEGKYYALSTTQNKNNRGQADVNKIEENVTFSTDVQVLTLEVGVEENTFAFNTGSGYLYAASSSANHLKTQEDLDVNGSWTISIDANTGVATVKAQGGNTHNLMQYNKSSKLFSSYDKPQQGIALYKKMPDYTREVDPQYYGTICLPKAGKFVGGSLYEVAYYDETTKKVYFDEVLNGEMEAGMPYIFLANATMIEAYYTNDEEATAKKKNGLYGTLVDITSGMNADGVYMIYRNQIIHSIHKDSYLKANRAYIKLTEVPGYNDPSYVAPAPAPGRKRIAMGTTGQNTATGVDQLQGDNVPTKMIINGQLFILRGEKMYDAQGKLVK